MLSKIKGEIRAVSAVCGLALAPLHPALAQTLCTVAAQGEAFGNYKARNAAPTETRGNIAVTCRGPVGLRVGYAILLSNSTAGTTANRNMHTATHTLSYTLYADPARSQVWGDGNAGTSTVTDGYVLSAIAVTRNYPVYGRLPAGQDVGPGSYTDSVTVTLNY